MGLKLPALLVGLGMLLALSGLPGGFAWDDHVLIAQFASGAGGGGGGDWAAAITQPFWRDDARGGQATGYYRPVISLSYTLEQQLFGARPLGYRVSNLVVHLLCIVLAWRWLRRRFGALSSGLSVLAVLPFLVHPSRVESAGWVSGRTDLWMVALLLIAGELSARRAPGWGVAIAAALAVFCKETAVVLPLLLAIDVWAGVEGSDDVTAGPLRHRGVRWAAIGVGVALLVRTLAVSTPGRLLAGIEAMPVRVLTTLGHYVHGGLWPFWPQVIMGPKDRSLPVHTVLVDAHTWLGLVVALAIGVLLVIARRRPRARPWVADGAWFLLPLLPVLNLLPLDLMGLAALRFLYLPVLGLCALLARGLLELPRPRVLVLVASLWCIALVAVHQVYALAWIGDRALWGYELSNHPDRLHAIEVSAEIEFNAGALEEAQRLFLSGAAVAAARDNVAEELRFTLRAARVLGKRIPDDDRASIEALRDFYRAVRTGGDATLSVGGVTRRIRVPKLFAAQSGADATWVLVPHAMVLMKVPDIEAAAALLREATEREPMAAEPPLLLAQARGVMGDFAGADAALGIARGRVGDDPRVLQLNGLLRAARERTAGAGDDPLAAAEAALMLAVPAQTRWLLSQHSTLADSRVLWWRLQIGLALSARDIEVARAWIERGEREHPEWAEVWREARSAAPPPQGR